jgi:DNA-binding FadR family transcriptional regulator
MNRRSKKNLKVDRSSAVKRAASALRRDVLELPGGQPIGSEEELLRRYDVSRPTLRQAAALLAQEQLLEVRRGVGGGYFASRPDGRAVAHMAAIFLRSRHATVAEVIDAVKPLKVELARLAATSRLEAPRAELREFIEREARVSDAEVRYLDFLRSEREFGRLLGTLSDNKIFALFIDILYDFCGTISRGDDLYIDHPERVVDYRRKRNRLAEAILDGDEESAVLSARRAANSTAEWMFEDLKRRVVGFNLVPISENVLPMESLEAPRRTLRPRVRG